MISPKLHPDAMKKVYMPMTNILLDTSDSTMASIVRDKVDPEMSIEGQYDKVSKQRMHLNGQPLSLLLLAYSIGKSLRIVAFYQVEVQLVQKVPPKSLVK
jgi:hypothetical protein